MPPKKKSKGGDALSTPTKKGKSSKNQMLPYSDMEGTTDGEEELSLKTMMSPLTSMNSRMSQYEERLNRRSNSASVHAVYMVFPEPSTSRATVDGSTRQLTAAILDGFPHMADEVRVRVDSCLRGTPTLYGFTDDKSSSEDEAALPAHQKQGLKTGKIRTTDSMVTKKVVWWHKVVYTTQGQSPVYSEMSISLFVN